MRTTTSKIVLVTGGARRLGRAVALSFARSGMDLVIHHHRSEREALRLVQELQGMGARAWALQADLTEEAACVNLVEETVRQAGGLDVLINNMATYRESRLLTVSPEALVADAQVNAYAPVVLARNAAKRGACESIINMLDCRMIDYDRRHVSYHLSKQMLYHLTRMLALELAPAVRVNGVAPGLILPPPGEGPEYLEERRKFNPLRGVGSAEAVVDAVHLLVSGDFITGQVVFVDGGRHLRGSVYG
jgi:pteridine reductase